VQGGDRLSHHPVAGIFEAPLALVVLHRHPLGPDDRQEDVAVLNRLPDHVGEVRTGLDRVHVHEDLEPLDQPVGQAAGDMAGVLTPVAHEHPGRPAHSHLQTMIDAMGPLFHRPGHPLPTCQNLCGLTADGCVVQKAVRTSR
jgi:hypothetical protein